MIVTQAKLDKIKELIEKKYKVLGISLLGTDKEKSLLELVYNHVFLNGATKGPLSLKEIKEQQENLAKLLPQDPTHLVAVSNMDSNLQTLIDKEKNNALTKILGLINNANMRGRNEAMINLQKPGVVSEKIETLTKNQLKQQLRDTTGDSNRSFERIAITEISNSLGLGSIDRVAKDNEGKDPNEVYVYKISVKDAAQCIHCKKLFVDGDGSPKVYTLSTILSNGSNYGRKPADYKAVASVVHANCRESGLIELKPGFKVNSDGSQSYVGLESWKKYIKSKVQK